MLDYVRAKTEAFLDEYPDDRHTAILRGALVSRELNAAAPKKTSSDSAFWQQVVVRTAKGRDGNLKAVVKRVEELQNVT